MPGYDHGEDDVSALTFFSSPRPDDDSGLSALRAQSPTHSPSPTTDVDAIRSVTGGATDEAPLDEAAEFLSKVTNQPGTVAVTALPDGSVAQIDLRPRVVNMSESALAEEILVIADLARQKGLAKQQAFLAEAMRAVGLDGDEQQLIESSVDLPTPQQAEAAQAEVFAARYATGTD